LPLFTIITITFNNRGGLYKTAQSIIGQTCTDYEWIIIDGASTDATGDDFINYPSAKIISETDNGIYDAMNKGLANATGHYIIFMNAGDSFAARYILEKVSFITKENPDFIYGDSTEDNHLKRARHHSKVNWGMFTHHQAMFYNRLSLGDIRYNLNYKIAADYDLTVQFLKNAKTILYLAAPICIFEAGGISQTNAKLGRDEQFESRKENMVCNQFTNHMISVIQAWRFFLRQQFPKLYWFLK